MRIIDENWMSPELDAEIRRGLVECFPQDAQAFGQTRAWHGSAPGFSVVLEEAGRVVAHVGVVQRRVRVGDVTVAAAGVQNVFVLPSHRGRRLSDRVLDAAMLEAQRRGGDAGLLFCSDKLLAVYARSGWHAIGADVWRVDEAGEEVDLPAGNFAMVLPLNRDWPPGDVHLCGNDW